MQGSRRPFYRFVKRRLTQFKAGISDDRLQLSTRDPAAVVDPSRANEKVIPGQPLRAAGPYGLMMPIIQRTVRCAAKRGYSG